MALEQANIENPLPSRIRSREVLGCGRWIQLEKITWIQKNGQPHHWEAVTRQGDGSCVLIVATLRPSGRLVLVRQYRPALDSICLEFPAGLVDAGESFEAAALRELREETGYVGEVKRVISPRAVSSGLTAERIAMVMMDIDENLATNQFPQADLEDSEDLEVFLLAKDQWSTLLQPPCGIDVDAKLTAYVLAAEGFGWVTS